MNRKNAILFVVMAALAAIYAIYFTDWFRPKSLHIFHTNRNLTPGRGLASSLIFGFNAPVQLTEIKVVPLAEYEMNAAVAPLWHLVAKPRSAPVKIFTYGERIEGMTPFIEGDRAQPLEPNISYRILVTAGKISGYNDFCLSNAPPAEVSAGQ
jgi:hypothetical protein